MLCPQHPGLFPKLRLCLLFPPAAREHVLHLPPQSCPEAVAVLSQQFRELREPQRFPPATSHTAALLAPNFNQFAQLLNSSLRSVAIGSLITHQLALIFNDRSASSGRPAEIPHPNLTKTINLQIQEDQQIPRETNTKQTTPRHIIINFLKPK